MSTSAPVAEAAGITRRFGSTVALRGARITVESGQTHALVGRNGAGKSTMVSILTGLQAPDEGTVAFGGERAPHLADRDAWRRRVACVYQKSTIIPQLTVAENLFLNRHTRTHGLIGWRALRGAAAELLATWSVDADPAALAADLTVEQRQFVEIARALSFGARFIVLDEPTAQLDASAITRLFGRMGELRQQGVTFLFISHHLQEVYDICDTVTVFRDARHILTAPVADLPRADLVAAMTGEAAGPPGATGPVTPHRGTDTGGPAVLTALGLSLGGAYDGVSFAVAPGEVVGVAGAGGSGRTELAETVAGLRVPDVGEVRVAGRRIRPGSVPAALAAGVGLVPQDRHHQGYVPGMSVADNSTLTITGRLGRWNLVRRGRRDAIARTMIENLGIHASGPGQPVGELSGGNQQKTVMARALADDPKVLVLITPTAGVDVRSKEFLLAKVRQTAGTGTGVLIASDELDDLRACDRVLVMFRGRIVAEMARGWHDHALVAAMEGVEVDV